jgi:hypothetical protein
VAGELCVCFEAADRADLGEQLRRGDGAAAGQLEQRRRSLGLVAGSDNVFVVPVAVSLVLGVFLWSLRG